MPYPGWDVPVGYGVLMAAFAVVHVFVSHFAIGGGLWLVVAERGARKAGDEGRLEFVRRVSRVFVLTTVVFGALTGVGIWFIIGLLNPRATEMLIRTFVWAWAIEWTMFAVEILAAILYWYAWKRLSARDHLKIGWVYFVAAWLSLVVINGIVTFMLTPGRWLESGSFWDGFLNPTYAPSLVLRTAICAVMAGLFTLFVAAGLPKGDLKARIVRGNALWAVLGLVAAAGAFLWYRASLPGEVGDAIGPRLSIPATSLRWLQGAAGALMVVVGFALVLPRLYLRPVGALALAFGLVAFGAFEWWREGARKPWAVTGVVYGNGVRVDEMKSLAKDGLLAAASFRTGDDGADLFRLACRTCHTLDGYNALRPAFSHTDPGFVEGMVVNLHQMAGKMPPFPGTKDEAATLAAWLWKQADQRSLTAATGASGAALGERLYTIRCAPCHRFGGFNDKAPKLSTYDRDTLEALLTDEEGILGMPRFSGSDDELKALLDYLGPKLVKGGG